jgi:hypothetical protein
MIKESQGSRWSMDRPPAYWALRRTRRALEEMDAAFAGYAALLTDAVSGRMPDDARFDALASRLNQGLRDLGDSTDAGATDRQTAGAAAGLSEALRRYLRNGRVADLRRAMGENQPWVEAYAARCAELVRLIRADLKASYADQAGSLQLHWDDKRAPGRAGLTRSLFNLNEEYVDAMESLDALARFYGDLPAAHRELGEALGRTARGKAGLASLYESGARVARLTRQLEKAK